MSSDHSASAAVSEVLSTDTRVDLTLVEDRTVRYGRSATGSIVREVHRRDGSVAKTDLRIVPETADLEAEADKAFLTTKTRPDWSVGDGMIRVADLFSGCGAMSVGVAEACRALGKGFESALACDSFPAALEVYARNFGMAVPPPRDLSQLSSILSGSLTPFEIGLKKALSGVDLVVAGPPCQGHSNLNNHTRREDPKNGLYFKVARFAKLFEPRFIIVENVQAVLKDKGQVVERTIDALHSMGYGVEHGVVDMPRIGVAQTRKRHILLAVRGDVGHRPPKIKDVVRRHEVAPRTVRWAIEDLLDQEVDGDLYRGAPRMTDITRERVEWLFREGEHNLPDSHRPDCHRTKPHTYGAVYGRMYWDKPAPTITGGFATMGQGRFVHPARPRTLTPHEAARVQFIPDYFDFSSVQRRNHMCEIIGNAVPPKLSYVVALELLR